MFVTLRTSRALDSETRTTTSMRFSQFLVFLHEPTPIWGENVLAIVILLQVLARMS